jgi:hypothetical protein
MALGRHAEGLCSCCEPWGTALCLGSRHAEGLRLVVSRGVQLGHRRPTRRDLRCAGRVRRRRRGLERDAESRGNGVGHLSVSSVGCSLSANLSPQAADAGFAGVGSLRLAVRRRSRSRPSGAGLRATMEPAGIEPAADRRERGWRHRRPDRRSRARPARRRVDRSCRLRCRGRGAHPRPGRGGAARRQRTRACRQ